MTEGAPGKSLEKKTERLVKLCKQVRDGSLDPEDDDQIEIEVRDDSN